MKIKQAEERINATYNTIKKYVEKNQDFYQVIEGIIHVTEEGLKALEEKYGIRSDILSDQDIQFYQNQLAFLRKQLEETQGYKNLFVKQLETKDVESELKDQRIQELESKLYEQEKKSQEQEIENLTLKYKLELEENKSIWKKIFKR